MCVCVRACVRACVRECVRECVRACVCACVRVLCMSVYEGGGGRRDRDSCLVFSVYVRDRACMCVLGRV